MASGELRIGKVPLLAAIRHSPFAVSTKTISLDAARDLVVAALTANRTSAENARSVAAALVGAEADGIKSHGLSRVPSYAGQARSGKVDGLAAPQVTSTAPATLVIDAA